MSHKQKETLDGDSTSFIAARFGLPRNALGLSRKGLTLLALGVALMICGHLFGVLFGAGRKPPGTPAADTPPAAPGLSAIQSYEEALSRKIEGLLAEVEGAGRVIAHVSLKSGPEVEYAGNRNRSERTTLEEMPGGSSRSTTEQSENVSLVVSRAAALSAGGESLFPAREHRPEISGVIVIAEGASNSAVAASLSAAVQTMLDIPAHRVAVLPRKAGD